MYDLLCGIDARFLDQRLRVVFSDARSPRPTLADRINIFSGNCETKFPKMLSSVWAVGYGSESEACGSPIVFIGHENADKMRGRRSGTASWRVVAVGDSIIGEQD